MLPRKLTVPEVLPMVQAYYRRNSTGGSLHIVLDDCNLEDTHVEFCERWAERKIARRVYS